MFPQDNLAAGLRDFFRMLIGKEPKKHWNDNENIFLSSALDEICSGSQNPQMSSSSVLRVSFKTSKSGEVEATEVFVMAA
jgi:hypothetical protein